LNLGVACLNLGDYDAAEKLLKKANVLDIANANVWGYMSLVMLKSGNRVNSAFQSIKEAIRLKIVNQNLLLECSKSFIAIGKGKIAKLALEYAITTRAQGQSRGNLKRIQEFLLQLSKVMTEVEK
jgi:tetratricopeptide (TPR) repeat protein